MKTSEDDVIAFSTMIRERKIDPRTYVRGAFRVPL